MLTRIEIDGFKTFEDFSLDLGPFTIIVGPNASGKSNLFDAIQLLSRLAEKDLVTAVKGLRGEPHELFRKGNNNKSSDQINLAVEVLINPEVRDPWGAVKKLSHTRIRYEVTIELREDDQGRERLYVSREEARPIYSRDDNWRKSNMKISKKFNQTYMKYSRRRKPWLSTNKEDGSPSFEISQDGKAGRRRPAAAAEATVLSSITSAEFYHLFALREELRSWRFLQLDPASLRLPSPTIASELLEPNGSNLATVLARIKAETKTKENPYGVISDVKADLGAIIPGVFDISIEEDKPKREYRIDIKMRGGLPFSSRVVSDGTLRVLALLTMLHDPKHSGLVCFEEPENGVHPARLKALIKRLRELVTQPGEDDLDPEDSLSQMLLNSHSPVAISALKEGEMMFADVVSIADPNTKRVREKTRVRPVMPKSELPFMTEGKYVLPYEVDQYLSSVERES